MGVGSVDYNIILVTYLQEINRGAPHRGPDPAPAREAMRPMGWGASPPRQRRPLEAGFDVKRRADLLQLGELGGRSGPGGRSRPGPRPNVGDIEADCLDGETALLGRRHDVPTPADEVVQPRARLSLSNGASPGAILAATFFGRALPPSRLRRSPCPAHHLQAASTTMDVPMTVTRSVTRSGRRPLRIAGPRYLWPPSP